jgi:hypothetical protein
VATLKYGTCILEVTTHELDLIRIGLHAGINFSEYDDDNEVRVLLGDLNKEGV